MSAGPRSAEIHYLARWMIIVAAMKQHRLARTFCILGSDQ